MPKKRKESDAEKAKRRIKEAEEKEAQFQKSMDDKSHLKDWGFSETHCFFCRKNNSEIDGYLMQCARCKKVYYCSKECFNNDVERHATFCDVAVTRLRRGAEIRISEPYKPNVEVVPEKKMEKPAPAAFHHTARTASGRPAWMIAKSLKPDKEPEKVDESSSSSADEEPEPKEEVEDSSSHAEEIEPESESENESESKPESKSKPITTQSLKDEKELEQEEESESAEDEEPEPEEEVDNSSSDAEDFEPESEIGQESESKPETVSKPETEPESKPEPELEPEPEHEHEPEKEEMETEPETEPNAPSLKTEDDPRKKSELSQIVKSNSEVPAEKSQAIDMARDASPQDVAEVKGAAKSPPSVPTAKAPDIDQPKKEEAIGVKPSSILSPRRISQKLNVANTFGGTISPPIPAPTVADKNNEQDVKTDKQPASDIGQPKKEEAIGVQPSSIVSPRRISQKLNVAKKFGSTISSQAHAPIVSDGKDNEENVKTDKHPALAPPSSSPFRASEIGAPFASNPKVGGVATEKVDSLANNDKSIAFGSPKQDKFKKSPSAGPSNFGNNKSSNQSSKEDKGPRAQFGKFASMSSVVPPQKSKPSETTQQHPPAAAAVLSSPQVKPSAVAARFGGSVPSIANQGKPTEVGNDKSEEAGKPSFSQTAPFSPTKKKSTISGPSGKAAPKFNDQSSKGAVEGVDEEKVSQEPPPPPPPSASTPVTSPGKPKWSIPSSFGGSSAARVSPQSEVNESQSKASSAVHKDHSSGITAPRPKFGKFASTSVLGKKDEAGEASQPPPVSSPEPTAAKPEFLARLQGSKRQSAPNIFAANQAKQDGQTADQPPWKEEKVTAPKPNSLISPKQSFGKTKPDTGNKDEAAEASPFPPVSSPKPTAATPKFLSPMQGSKRQSAPNMFAANQAKQGGQAAEQPLWKGEKVTAPKSSNSIQPKPSFVKTQLDGGSKNEAGPTMPAAQSASAKPIAAKPEFLSRLQGSKRQSAPNMFAANQAKQGGQTAEQPSQKEEKVPAPKPINSITPKPSFVKTEPSVSRVQGNKPTSGVSMFSGKPKQEEKTSEPGVSPSKPTAEKANPFSHLQGNKRASAPSLFEKKPGGDEGKQEVSTKFPTVAAKAASPFGKKESAGAQEKNSKDDVVSNTPQNSKGIPESAAARPKFGKFASTSVIGKPVQESKPDGGEKAANEKKIRGPSMFGVSKGKKNLPWKAKQESGGSGVNDATAAGDTCPPKEPVSASPFEKAKQAAASFAKNAKEKGPNEEGEDDQVAAKDPGTRPETVQKTVSPFEKARQAAALFAKSEKEKVPAEESEGNQSSSRPETVQKTGAPWAKNAKEKQPIEEGKGNKVSAKDPATRQETVQKTVSPFEKARQAAASFAKNEKEKEPAEESEGNQTSGKDSAARPETVEKPVAPWAKNAKGKQPTEEGKDDQVAAKDPATRPETVQKAISPFEKARQAGASFAKNEKEKVPAEEGKEKENARAPQPAQAKKVTAPWAKKAKNDEEEYDKKIAEKEATPRSISKKEAKEKEENPNEEDEDKEDESAKTRENQARQPKKPAVPRAKNPKQEKDKEERKDDEEEESEEGNIEKKIAKKKEATPREKAKKEPKVKKDKEETPEEEEEEEESPEEEEETPEEEEEEENENDDEEPQAANAKKMVIPSPFVGPALKFPNAFSVSGTFPVIYNISGMSVELAEESVDANQDDEEKDGTDEEKDSAPCSESPFFWPVC